MYRIFCVSDVSLDDPRSTFLVKSVCVSVFDIPSVERRDVTCGSVSFGESFIESILHVEMPGESCRHTSTAYIYHDLLSG